jgi:hypothetical protein
MNNEENHGFTSFDFITVMVSFAIIAAVTFPIIQKNIQSDQTVERARQEASDLGRTLINPKNLTQLSAANGYTMPQSSRSIASIGKSEAAVHLSLDSIKEHMKNGEWEGDIGKDPWGHPYHFSFLKNSKGMTTHVAVWSDGPNNKNETSVHNLLPANQKSENIEFKGDDLGSVIPLR